MSETGTSKTLAAGLSCESLPQRDQLSVSERSISVEKFAKKINFDSEKLDSGLCERKLVLESQENSESINPRAKTGPILDRNYVSKEKRRGLLSALTILPEIDDARNYKKLQKLTVVFIVAFAAVAGPMGTTILLPAVQDLCTDLDTSLSTVNISVGVYLLSLGIFPMWWTNFSEKHGRRSVYVLSFSIFFAFSVACTVAPSIGSLIGFRLLAGVGASAVQSCGAGTISDLYIQEERGTALGLFYLGPLLGPFMSPIIGGAVAEKWGWRASMWIMVIVCGVNLVSIIFLLPETLPRDDNEKAQMNIQENDEKEETQSGVDEEACVDSGVLNPKSIQESPTQETPRTMVTRKSWWSQIYDHTIRPVHAMVLLTYLPVLLVIFYSSIGSTGIYFLNISISNAYSQPPYNFSPVIVGLMYIPNSVAFILTSIYGGRWNDRLIKRSIRNHNGIPRPESRLSWNIVLAAVVYPPACMILGWCIEKKQHWATPLVGSALLGLSAMLIMGSTVTYLVDILPGKGATGVALNNFVRQMLAATAMFVTEPAVVVVGTGVLFCIFAGVVSVAAIAILVLKHHGPHLREKYALGTYYAKL